MSRKTPRTPNASADPPPALLEGDVLRPVYVGRLETVADWRRQLGKIFREMRRGQLRPEDGTKLAFVANLGAQLAKVEEELKVARAMNEQLAQLQGRHQIEAPRLSIPIAGATQERTMEWAKEGDE